MLIDLYVFLQNQTSQVMPGSQADDHKAAESSNLVSGFTYANAILFHLEQSLDK